MYHQMVKRIIRRGFQNISSADFEPLLRQFAPDVHFTFVGDHALGADFHHREMVRRWFDRLHHIFPGFHIEADQIIVSGFPWNTSAAVHFTVYDTLPDGVPYRNRGVQVVRIVWGRVVDDYLIDDSQLLATTLRHLADRGVAEALQPPLTDPR
ncbi:MAG: nuclear transport factor 2 family protein [Anaerolineae bacterium]|nr:nuclear transport factor 2 family protein [Anaerolineae bacterium]